MCGRFAQYSNSETLQKHFSIDKITCEVIPNYNVAPTREIPAIIEHDRERRLGTLRWGLVPFWAKDLSGASRLINARAESAHGKPSFRHAFKRRRCLIPADGFYEWQKQEEGRKQPFFITLPSKAPFAFAGLWESWKNPEDEGERYDSCTILTTDAGEAVRHIHNRMPVILKPEDHAFWLDPDNADVEGLRKVVLKEAVQDLAGYPVSRRVNSVKNNEPGLIEVV